MIRQIRIFVVQLETLWDAKKSDISKNMYFLRQGSLNTRLNNSCCIDRNLWTSCVLCVGNNKAPAVSIRLDYGTPDHQSFQNTFMRILIVFIDD